MDLKSINDIFKDRIFRIPSYQRGYSWANNKQLNLSDPVPFKNVTGQLKDIWEDIKNIKENSWHYTGLLTLAKAENEYDWLPNHQQYEIVDGQQRITTILILIQVLVEKSEELKFEYGIRQGDTKFQYLMIESAAKAYIFGYDSDNPSDKFFKKWILNADVILNEDRESVYTENLKKAKDFFKDAIQFFCEREAPENVSKESALKNLFKKVISQLKFNEYVLPKEELNEYVVFETMNNRGKPLSELEKLKNRLMYLNDKLPLYNSEHHEIGIDQEKSLNAQCKQLMQDINTAWITIYQSLGSNKQKPLSDEEFVKNHWIIYFDEYDRSESNVYSNFLFDDFFTINNVYNKSITKKDIEDYIKSLQLSSTIWNKLNNPNFFENEEIEFKNLINRLHRVGFKSSFKPLVMAILLKTNREEYKKIISLLEDYSFKLFDIADRQSNTGNSTLYRLAYKVYKSNLSAEYTYNEIEQHLKRYYSFNLFKNQIEELFRNGDRKGYYGWSGLRYFLFEYDQNLRRENAINDQTSEIIWDKDSIEHIYPQSAALDFEEYYKKYKKNDPQKAKVEYDKIQADWVRFSDFPKEKRWAICNSLGNLLALTSSLNASLTNDAFKFKVDQSLKSQEHQNKGFKYDSISARMVANNPDWTLKTIKNRGIQMLDFLWGKLHPNEQNILTNEEKLNLLGLEFLINENSSNI